MLPFATSIASGIAPPTGTHVYLLGGVLNIFSFGLDEIAAKLQAQGHSHYGGQFCFVVVLAEEAAPEYKSGGVRTIVLIGHSSGATALPDMVARLTQFGVRQISDRTGLRLSYQTGRSR